MTQRLWRLRHAALQGAVDRAAERSAAASEKAMKAWAWRWRRCWFFKYRKIWTREKENVANCGTRRQTQRCQKNNHMQHKAVLELGPKNGTGFVTPLIWNDYEVRDLGSQTRPQKRTHRFHFFTCS